jgi:probable HAF family extracellular repeat protein
LRRDFDYCAYSRTEEGEMKRKARWITLAFILAVASPVHQAMAYYKLIDLGILPGQEVSVAYSINNNGQIVGYTDKHPELLVRPNPIATLFDPTGGGNNIALCETVSQARSINNLGQIVGWAYDGSGKSRATLFDPTGSGNNINLGTLGGWVSIAYSINNNGQIVGGADGKATLFDPTGGGNNIDLGTLGGWVSIAYSINNNGQIVGGADGKATLFDPTGGGNNIDLGSLGGGWSEAFSINDFGQIVGQFWVSSWESRATLFDPTGGGNNIDLGALPGEWRRISLAFSINNLGQIVGTADRRAVLFDPTGGGNNIDLNTLIDPSLGWTLTEAYSINDNGWIVGQGFSPDGDEHGYLLIPEPATLSLFALAGLAILRKRRK